jgi:hypothetical protein
MLKLLKRCGYDMCVTQLHVFRDCFGECWCFLEVVISLNRAVFCSTLHRCEMCLEPYGSRFDAMARQFIKSSRRGEMVSYSLSCVLLLRSVSEYTLYIIYNDSR